MGGLASWAGRHFDEAFSSLRIADFKNFLRMHIGTDGDLTIYAIGIDTATESWEEDPCWSQGADSGRGARAGAKQEQEELRGLSYLPAGGRAGSPSRRSWWTLSVYLLAKEGCPHNRMASDEHSASELLDLLHL